MKTIMLVFGTRPEAIKMCPLVNELKTRENIKTVVCVTGQHRQMLDMVLDTFKVVPDYDLSIMKAGQTLFDITTNILNRIGDVLDEVKPDVVLVHGDTSTTFVTALACFYKQIAIGHVEAGLRTYNIYSPYPEEFNRQAVSIISKYNFAPTELSKANLVKEGKDESTIYITGNTAIDALKTTVRDDYTHPELEWAKDSRLIMITAHRRENLGEPMHNMFRAIRRVMDEHSDVKAIYPIHMNPVVRQAADEELGGCDRIHIIEPLEVLDFHNFLARSFMILTDSGGIQEEAPSLGKPVLVMRDTTERPEGIKAGTLKLVGTDEQVIYDNFKLLLENDVPPMYVPTCCRESPWFRSSSRGVGMCVNAKRFPHFNAFFISPRIRFQEQEDDNPTRCVDVWYCTLEPNEPVKLWPHVSYQISLGLIVHRPLCH